MCRRRQSRLMQSVCMWRLAYVGEGVDLVRDGVGGAGAWYPRAQSWVPLPPWSRSNNLEMGALATPHPQSWVPGWGPQAALETVFWRVMGSLLGVAEVRSCSVGSAIHSRGACLSFIFRFLVAGWELVRSLTHPGGPYLGAEAGVFCRGCCVLFLYCEGFFWLRQSRDCRACLFLSVYWQCSLVHGMLWLSCVGLLVGLSPCAP